MLSIANAKAHTSYRFQLARSARYNRQNRPFDRDIALAAIEYNSYEQTGDVLLTDSQGYIDYITDFGGDDKYTELVQLTYGVIFDYYEKPEGSAIQKDPMFIFLDKFERSNIIIDGAEKTSVRIHFSVDWWTTLMFGRLNLTRVSGTVTRAHVNDRKKSHDVVLGDVWIHDLSYTTLDAEEDIAYTDVISEPITADKRRYMIMSTTKGGERYGTYYVYPSPSFPVGDKCFKSTTSCYMYVVDEPTFKANIGGETFVYTITFHGQGGDSAQTHTGDVIAPDIITDSDVYSIFLSEVGDTSQWVTFDYPPPLDKISEWGNAKSFSCFSPAGKEGSKAAMPLWGEFPALRVNYESAGIYTAYNAAPLRVNPLMQVDYDTYIHDIPKLYHAPYTVTEITKGATSFALDTAFIDSADNLYYEFNVVPQLGGYIFYAPSSRIKGEQAYHLLRSEGETYQRTATNDQFTATRLISSTLGTLIGAVGTAATGNFIGSAQAAAGAVGSLSDTAQKIRQGEGGTKSVTSFATAWSEPLSYRATTPTAACRASIGYNLHKKGYSTHLPLHEILQNHLRWKFNYVEMTNVHIAGVPPFVELDIKDFLENGAYIWHQRSMYFNTRNYPQIMGEVYK